MIKMVGKRALWPFILLSLVASPGPAQSRDAGRDKIEQPDKVMEATGVKPGMVIGEIGAGQGYFTFWLSQGVGKSGKVYANDISGSALAAIERRCESEKVSNIETVLGALEDPRFPPASLDMAFMVNVFHDLERPVELLAGLLPAMKPGAPVVVMDRDPARFKDAHGHFLARDEVERMIGRSVFELVRVETFLRDHNLYILRARR